MLGTQYKGDSNVSAERGPAAEHVEGSCGRVSLWDHNKGPCNRIHVTVRVESQPLPLYSLDLGRRAMGEHVTIQQHCEIRYLAS